MYTNPINPGIGALSAAVQMIAKAERQLLEATRAVAEGDILEAAINVKEAEFTAKSGAALARAANRISESVLDILA